MSRRTLAAGAALLALSVTGFAQVLNPGDPALQSAQEAKRAPDPLEESARAKTWEMPVTLVRGARASRLREEDAIGPYAQPRWTARRLFPTTRVYVRPPGVVQLEHWTRVKVPDRGSATTETQYELEVGLPGRFQLDLYYVTEKDGGEGSLDVSEQKYELRYALADWGEIFLNPTLYFEYVQRNGQSDKIEGKLLLGEELAEGWHFGSNLVFEHELGGAGENEYGLTLGVARSVIDQKLSLGAEVKTALVDEHADRGDYTKELEIGPSLRWFPMPQMHVDFAPLVGIGGESRDADLFLVVGWEL